MRLIAGLLERPRFLWVLLLSALPASADAADHPLPGKQAAAQSQIATDLPREMTQERALGGYGDMAPIASALLIRAQEAADPETAEALIRLAAQAAPSDPRPHAQLIRLSTSDKLHPLTALQELGALVWDLVRDPWVQSVAALRAAAVLCVAAWAVSLALLLLCAASFCGPLFHDYADSFPSRFRRITPAAFAALVLATLYAAGVGPAALFLLMAVLASSYLPSRGRIALGLSLAIGCLLPTSLEWVSRPSLDSGARAWALYRVLRGDASDDLAQELRRRFRPEEGRGLYARAQVARRQGNYRGAMELLRAAIGTDVGEGALRLELGNLLFLDGDTGTALVEYRRAAALLQDDPVPWLNQHLALLARLELAGADQALDRARALDQRAVAHYESRFPPGTGVLLPVSEPLQTGWVRAELLGGSEARAPWADRLNRGLFTPVQALHPGYFGLGSLVVVLVRRNAGQGRHSHRCLSCGAVVCPRCSRRVRGKRLCPACWSANREFRADAAEKDRHVQRIAKWRAAVRRWDRLGTAMLPGWGEYLFRSPGRGLALGVAWAVVLGWVVQGLLYPADLFPWSETVGQALGVLLLALAHLVGAVRGFRAPRRA